MKRVIAKILLWAYIRLVRSWTSPLVATIMLWRVKPNKGVWDEYKYLHASEFEKRLRLVKYSGDPMGGLADYTIRGPEYFWADGIPNIDCDDFAYMWFLWAKKNCDEAWLVVIMDGLGIDSSHYFTVVKMRDNYHLCNYDMDRTECRSLADCIALFSKRSLVKHGPYKNPVTLIDKHWKQKKEEGV